MKQIAKLLFGMGLLLAGSQSAFAALNLTPTVLNATTGTPNSCYSYRTHTVATSPQPFLGNGQEMVGVMCFDAPTFGTTGTVTDGHFRDAANTARTTFTCLAGTNSVTGTYHFNLNNLDYYGGGWINLNGAPATCQNSYDIVVNNVSGTQALGFQLIKRAPTPDPAAFVLGGTAFYQGPQPTTPPGYYSPVLNGCYSFLSESVLTSPTFPTSGPGKDLLGTICFTPGGTTNPTGTLTFGRTRDLNGVITHIYNPNGICTPCTGSYTVTSTPGWGMGTMYFVIPTGLTFEFAPFDIVGGVAQGFLFTLHNPANPAGSRLEGGTAYFQQP